VTVDPHLHRIHELSEIYDIEATVVHAAPVVAEWIREHVPQPVLVGPDEESAQWVAATAERIGAPHLVLHKVRRGDTDVSVEVPQVDRWREHTPVLVDDIISTGRTLVQTIGHLRAAGMQPPVCVAVHALFAGDAWEALQAAGAGRVVTCNTVAHVSNGIDVVPLLAEALLPR
jgi:ribose-phosphate pyrophosphokinase